jgi:hypothetical protein
MDKKNFFRNAGKTIAIILFAATGMNGFAISPFMGKTRQKMRETYSVMN